MGDLKASRGLRRTLIGGEQQKRPTWSQEGLRGVEKHAVQLHGTHSHELSRGKILLTLGKVFESLMAEDERAASGSFYTPKEIVETLTRRAIVEWLSRSQQELRDDLHAFLERGEMSSPLANAAPALAKRLEKISILDPACGSGAFLLSALHVIEKLLECGGHAAALERSHGDRTPDHPTPNTLRNAERAPQ